MSFPVSSSLQWAVQKWGFKIDPILLNWIHPVPGFNFILEFSCTVNNRVGYVGRLDLGV